MINNCFLSPTEGVRFSDREHKPTLFIRFRNDADNFGDGIRLGVA